MDDARNKLLLQLTGQEFVDLLREGLGLSMLGYDEPQPMEVKKHLVYGLQGLCDLLGCSTSTAARIKKSGVIDAAISQTGKIIVIDADLALDLLNSHKKKGGVRGGYKRRQVITIKTSSIMNENINNQGGATIVTLHPSKVAQAYIYDNEQRATIIDLIKRGFKPHHTSVGVGNAGKKLWNVEKYKGRFGKGFKMITKSPFSTNFNHLTYFTIA